MRFNSSVAQSCLTLCDPRNHSMPGLPVHHQLPEFIQTHVHWVSDVILPSHPLSSPSSPALSCSEHQSFPMSQLFAWGGQCTGVSALASFLPKKSQGWSPSEWTGWISLQSKWLSVTQSCPTLWLHGLQQARLPCLSPSPRVCSNSCLLSWWYHPTISSSIIPFSSCLQFFPSSGLFQWVGSSHQMDKALEPQFQHQSFQWVFRVNFL